MEKNTLVVNIGSSSKKYHLYRGSDLLIDAHLEHDKGGFVVTYTGEDMKDVNEENYKKSLIGFCKYAKEKGLISEEKPISLVGIRIVAPGEYFTSNHEVDNDFLENLEKIARTDQIHIEPIQTEIKIIKEQYPDIKMVAISDSSFHSTMPRLAHYYAIPTKLASETDLYRFGFHGISISSIVRNLTNRASGIEKRVIICHLGSGASVTAILDGKSIDTSMGYSPLEGLVMSSRVGNIDAGAVLHLAEKYKAEELQQMFYSESGLLALSGLSEDMRVLLDAEKNGHVGAKLAVESFIYNVRKYIGAYSAIMEGIDALVFAGTIGERSSILRRRICENLEFLKIDIDLEKNEHIINDMNIGREGKLPVYVMHGDEAGEILRLALEE